MGRKDVGQRLKKVNGRKGKGRIGFGREERNKGWM